MLTRANNLIETRDVTWEATLRAGAPSSPLPKMPEQGRTMGLGKAPEPGGTDDFASAPTTQLPVSGRGISHQLRAVSPMTQAGGDLQSEGLGLNDSSIIISESSDSDSSSRHGSDASPSDDEAPTPTSARTAPRQLGVHMSGPSDGENIREGRTRAQIRALNQKEAAGLISMIDLLIEAANCLRCWRRKRQALNRLSCRSALSRSRNRNRRSGLISMIDLVIEAANCLRCWRRKRQAVNRLSCRNALSRSRNRNGRRTPQRVRQGIRAFGRR